MVIFELTIVERSWPVLHCDIVKQRNLLQLLPPFNKTFSHLSEHDDINTLHGTYQYLKSTGQVSSVS